MEIHASDKLCDIRSEEYGTPKRPFRSICTFTTNTPIQELISLYFCNLARTFTHRTVQFPLPYKNHSSAKSNLIPFLSYGAPKFEKTRFLLKFENFKRIFLKNGSNDFWLNLICLWDMCLLWINISVMVPDPWGTLKKIMKWYTLKTTKKNFFFN
jgi:hypothetical protein